MTTALVRTRPATLDDLDAIVDLHARCSAETLRSRFHAPVTHVPPRLARQLIAPRDGWSVLAEQCGEVIGLGCAAPVSRSTVEVGLLVEDLSQGTGVGSRMLRDLARGGQRPRLRPAGLPGGGRQRVGAAHRATSRPRRRARAGRRVPRGAGPAARPAARPAASRLRATCGSVPAGRRMDLHAAQPRPRGRARPRAPSTSRPSRTPDTKEALSPQTRSVWLRARASKGQFTEHHAFTALHRFVPAPREHLPHPVEGGRVDRRVSSGAAPVLGRDLPDRRLDARATTAGPVDTVGQDLARPRRSDARATRPTSSRADRR